MQILSLLRPVSFVAVLASAGSLVGCVYDTDPPRRLAPDPHLAPPPPSGGSGGGGPTSDPGQPSPQPMLVEVDPDQTMDAESGEGVGVFVEYGSGGHWHIWWTCDTNRTLQSCDFEVNVSASKISNVDRSGLGDGSLDASETNLRAITRTATEAHGIRFDTEPGATITLEASVGGLTDGSFLFFVQDGQVNGGYAGKLTNPLMLQGKTP